MALSVYKDKVDNLIKNYIELNNDCNLKEMLYYSLDGGKRLRSIIALYIFDENKKEFDDVVVALELLHNASLILDDLPCMDNDDYRRNKLSFHKKYGIKNAYIISNFLFSEFNRIIRELKNNYLMKYVFEKLKHIILGQYYDLFPKSDDKISIDERIKNNNLKTTPFFVLSFFLPLYLCDSNIDKISIENCAVSFSTAFQIYDDFLDIEQDKLTNNFNNIKYFGKLFSYKLYLKNLKIFNNEIDKIKIDKKIFIEIINYLNIKLKPYINELQ